MSKISNVLTMIELLSTGKKYSIQELSDILEVTPRMIRVYKDEMEKAGIYVDTVRGPYGGYVLNQSIRLPSRKFNKKDLELLNDIKNKFKLNDESFYVFYDKVRGTYQGSKNEYLELKEENLDKYNILNRAIKERKKVKILYYSYNKGESERIIHPYDMFLYNNGWGCAAFCENKKDLRHFELKRIRNIELLKDNY